MIKKIDHIGIVVKSLDDALKVYREAFGLELIMVERLRDMNVRIAFIRVGEVLIELLEPLGPDAGMIGEFLEENGEGLHHIAYRVKNIKGALERLKQANAPLWDELPREGADASMIAFIEPSFTQNVLTELVERSREVAKG